MNRKMTLLADRKAPIASAPTASLLARKCACGQHMPGGRQCTGCSKEVEGTTLHRAEVRSEPLRRDGQAAPPLVHDVLRASGQPLDSATRAYMAPRFGHDFSQVRGHHDDRAAESAQAVNALAYTVGHDIVFGRQQYAPLTTSGQRLLAHELAHVVQQSGGIGLVMPFLRIGAADDAHEQEAEVLAARVVDPQWERQLAIDAGSGKNALRATENHESLSHSNARGTLSAVTTSTLARQTAPPERNAMQCINANLANAGIPWAVLWILGSVCAVLGAVVTSPSGPGAAVGGISAAAACISVVTGLGVGMIIGIITRCIEDPSVEWRFAAADEAASADNEATA